MLKTFSRFSIEKSNIYFQPTNLEPVIDCLLRIHQWLWDLRNRGNGEAYKVFRGSFWEDGEAVKSVN